MKTQSEQWKRKMLTRLRAILITVGLVLSGVVGMAGTASADTTLCTGYSACVNSGHTDHGYGANNANSYWHEYTGDNCTNYAAYMEVQNGFSSQNSYNPGDASSWGSYFSSYQNTTPAVGSIAWWGSSDHVAYVESIAYNSNGTVSSITISEDSWGGSFDWRVIPAGSSTWPNGFLHFKDVSTATSSHYAPLTGDFNHDGYADIVLHDSVDGSWHILYGPSFTTGFGYTWAGGSNYQPFVGDFNGDGYADIGLRDTTDGSIHILYGPNFTTGVGFSWAAGTNYGAFTGDFNGDGYSDIGIRDSVDGSWHILYGPSFTTGFGYTWAAGSNYIPFAGDFANNGVSGIGLYDTNTGLLFFKNGPNFASNQSTYQWAGGSNYQPFVGDFNGDGYADIGLRDVNTGLLYFKNGPNFATNQSNFQWAAG